MTERNLREFDKITRREGGGPGDRDRPLSPGVSSIKSSRSLHELGLGNYPYPEIPASTKLTRSQERQSLQNLNNRLAGYIDKVNSGRIAQNMIFYVFPFNFYLFLHAVASQALASVSNW